MVEQNNELLMKNHKYHLTGSTRFLDVNVVTHDHYTNGQTHGGVHCHSHGCGCSGNLKHTHLPTRSGKIAKRNMKRKNVSKITNMLKTCAIAVMAKVIGLVPIIHQSILSIFIKNHLKIERRR